MGTILIEEYGSVGSAANRDTQIEDLNTLLATTKDATTSASAEYVTLNSGTRVVTVVATEAHRVCMTSDTSASKYAIVQAAEKRSFGVKPGDKLYYELDA